MNELWPQSAVGWFAFAVVLGGLLRALRLYRMLRDPDPTCADNHRDTAPFTAEEYDLLVSPRGWSKRDERAYQGYLDAWNYDYSVKKRRAAMLDKRLELARADADERNQFADEMLRALSSQ